MNKAARNERRKLTATWLNGVSIASVAVGGIAPTVAAIIGGWLAVRFALDDDHAGWMGVAGILAAVAVAASVGRRERAGVSNRATLGCLAISCVGVWACVPETDGPGRFALVLGVAAAAAAVLGTEIMDALVGAGAVALLTVGLAGGQFRASAVVGAIGVMGVLVIAWLVLALSLHMAGRMILRRIEE